MCLLIESIRLENNILKNIELHNERFNWSRYKLFGISHKENLSELISIREQFSSVQRVRVTYGREINKIEILPYTRAKIEKLQIIEDNDINYSYKYADRSMLSKYLGREKYDILIIKNGFVTDTSISNVAFLKDNDWYTPHTYLLKGIMREMLIKSGQIKETHIRYQDLNKFSKIRLINAFNDFENPFELGIEAITPSLTLPHTGKGTE